MIDQIHFKGKTALVTGGSRGIGAAIVKQLYSLGANVAFTYNKSSATALEIEKNCPGAKAIQADSPDMKAALNAVKQTIDTFKTLDILIINAGITRDRVSWRLPESDFDAVISTNLKGAFSFVKAAVPHMRDRQQGKIITISSINGLRGKAGQVAYAASKGGLIAFTKSLAKELGVKNINVNSVAPGFILTDMTASVSEQIKENALNETALKRFGTPDDVANAAVFLASDMSGHITGQVLNVDGGQLI
jgi:3-oxoacyl-[acyl-carrier protein] reductase